MNKKDKLKWKQREGRDEWKAGDKPYNQTPRNTKSETLWWSGRQPQINSSLICFHSNKNKIILFLFSFNQTKKELICLDWFENIL